jgi:hypothetical protein
MENLMNNTNKLTGRIALGAALGAALAMPMAFAQTAPTTDDAAAPQSTAPQSTAPAAQAPTAEPKQVTWADLDTDKDGSLTKTEVATVPALSQVFDQADADADGKLTADEYKAFAAKDAGGAAGSASGG